MAFASRFAGDPVRAAPAALLAVTVSELFALVFLAERARGEGRVRLGKRLSVRRPADMGVFFAALPVMAAAALLPLSHMLDSVVIVRLLSRHTAEAVSLYGLFAGSAASLIGLPATVCYGLVAASVPAVAACASRGEEEEARRRAALAVLVTVALAAPCAVGLFVLARPVVALLYPSLTAGEAETLVTLLRLSSVSAASLAGLDTLSACLTGLGRPRVAALAFTAAAGAKLLLEAGLLQLPQLSVFGAAYAAGASYFIALFLNLVYSIKERGNRLRLLGHAGKFAAMAAIAAAAALPLRGVHVLACLAAGGAAYLLAAFAFRAFSAEEIPLLRRKGYGHHRRIGYKGGRSVGRRRLRAPFGRARRAAHGRDRARRRRARVGRAL